MEKYWISGIQLGMLIAIEDEELKRKLVFETIIENQFLGNSLLQGERARTRNGESISKDVIYDASQSTSNKRDMGNPVVVTNPLQATGLATEPQLKYLKDLQDKGQIPKDLNLINLTTEEARIILKEALEKPVETKKEEVYDEGGEHI